MLAAGIILIGVVLAYTWLVYPALVLWLGRRGRGISFGAGDVELPSVVIIFSAHNEEANIEDRLANLAAVDYPAERMRIRVGVDGGTDRTAALAQAWAASHPNVTVVVAEKNRGKMAMLKRLVAEEQTADRRPQIADQGEEAVHCSPSSLLVFTDANTMFAPDALRLLVAPFVDPAVGGVCGRLVLEHGSAGKTDERAYWDTESRLKEAESQLDSCLGANGAIYAIRANLFPRDIPDNTIVDDFVIGMKVREQGLRMLFEPRAVAREELPPAVSDEWRRRVRIGAGAYQALALCRRSLLPAFGVFSWVFWSHKVLRWFTPHLMLVALGLAGVWGGVQCSVFGVQGWRGGGHAAVVAALVVLGAALFVVLAFRAKARVAKPIRLAGYFMAMQAALFVGFIRFCRGGLTGAWQRTGR